MIGSLSVATTLEKNRVSSDVPFFACLEVDVKHPITQAFIETINLVSNSENITYQGTVYTAYPFELDLKQEAGAEAAITISIQDVAGVVKQRMEGYGGLVGSTVRVVVLNSGLATSTPRSNLVQYSEDFTQTIWAKTGVTIASVTPPAGMNSFQSVIATAANSQHRILENVSVVAGTDYWVRVKVKAAGYRYARLGMAVTGFAAGADLGVDLETGEILSTTAGVMDAKVTHLGDGVYEVALLTDLATSSATSFVVLSTLETSPNPSLVLTFLGDGVSGLAAGEFHVHPASHSPNYVRTHDATILNVLPSFPAEIVETFEIIDTATNDYGVSWKLGAEQHLGLSFPRRTQDRHRCRWRYKGPECGYAGVLPTCDYSLSGSDGCAVHGNEPRFGAFPGILPAA